MKILFTVSHLINSFINLFFPVSHRGKKNFFNNKATDEETKGNYIVRQSHFKNVFFGTKPVSYNGCGIIALHNILLCLGKEKPFSQIILENEKNALLRGLFGLSPTGLKSYLFSNGFAVTEKGKFSDSDVDGKPFIHFYFRKNLSAHYVAAIPKENGHIFLNSCLSYKTPESLENYEKAAKKDGLLYECVYIIEKNDFCA